MVNRAWPLALIGLLSCVASAGELTEDSPEFKRGRLLYLQCRACHGVAAGEPHKVGPNLHGVLGSKAASRAGFAYSDALEGADLTWDPATLDRWLVKPSAVVPGNTMAFAGIPKPEDRAAIIAYLTLATR